jgi:hypothetical protein
MNFGHSRKRPEHTKPTMIPVQIHLDGSNQSPTHRGGPKKPGGAAAVITWPEGNGPDRVVVAGEMETTIGRMELLGLVAGLRYLYWLNREDPDRSPEENAEWSRERRPENHKIAAITDSKFLEQSATGQIGRKAALDLWKEFDR